MTMNYTAPGQNPVAPIATTASGSIAVGNLVTLLESGSVVKTDPVLGIANENNTTNGPVSLSATGNDTGANAGSLRNDKTVDFLSDGNVAYTYSGDGTTITTGVRVKVKSPIGGTIATTVLSADTGVNFLMLHTLRSTDKFVVLWTASGNASLMYAVCNNDGSVFLAATAVATITTSGQGQFSSCVLATGDFVVAYSKSTNLGVCFKRYNSSGVLQGAETTVEAAAVSTNSMAMLACANGDFVLQYFRATAASTHKFARYSSSGAVVVALTSMNTSNGGFNDCLHQAMAELSNGNIVSIASSAVSSIPYAYVYSAAGALVKAIDIGTNYGRTVAITPVVALASGFAVASDTGGFVYLRTFDNNGNAVLGPTFPGMNSGGDGQWSLSMFESGNSLTFIKTAFDSGSGNYFTRISVTTLNGVVKGSVVLPEADATTQTFISGAAMSAGKTLAYVYRYSTFTSFRTYRCSRCSVLGVALNSAADRGTVAVATKGSYTLPAAQTFGIGGAFDQRTATVPGTRGLVAGRSAVLLGYT
jgi:hypothetical protein